MSRRVELLAIATLIVASSNAGHAQNAPSGAHYAARASDTGHAGPGERGGFGASVPLGLPAARGGLPVPVQLVFTGRGFGAGGVGWDVPLSFVHVDRSFAHRRPAHTPGWVLAPRERVSVALPQRSVELLRRSSDYVGRDAADITMRAQGNEWLVYDGQGFTYRFSQEPSVLCQPVACGPGADLSGTGMWLLKSITASGGASVELTYAVAGTTVPPSVKPAISIDLSSVRYNPHPANPTCFKNEVTLFYALPLAPQPESVSVFGTRVLVRDHRLAAIDVSSRASCASAPERLRRYAFDYVADADTQQERLIAVNVSGRQGTAEENSSLPVARYTYGHATSTISMSGGGCGRRCGGRVENVLWYGDYSGGWTQNVATPADGPQTEQLFQVPFNGPIAYGSTQSLLDLTGDGRPDFIYRDNDEFHLARNRPDSAGWTDFGMALSPPPPVLGSNTLNPEILDGRVSNHTRFDRPADTQENYEYTATQWIDINGDGRLDYITSAEVANYWVVYLNTPDPGPSGIKWVRRALDVRRVYDRLEQLGMLDDDTSLSMAGHLPLSRRHTGRHTYGELMCWRWDGSQWVEDPSKLTVAPNTACSTTYLGNSNTIVSAVRYNHVVTITTQHDHGLKVGDTVIVEGVAEFGGEHVVTSVPTSTQIQYNESLWDASQTGGSLTQLIFIQPLRGMEKTYVEWELKDINGDGYPDFVYNTSPLAIQYFDQSGSLPPTGATDSLYFDQEYYGLRFTSSNRVEAMLNVAGVFIGNDADSTATDPFSAETKLTTSDDCGVARWSSGAPNYWGLAPDPHSTSNDCGIEDVNGDGLADRVVGATVRLGNGAAFTGFVMQLPAEHAVISEQKSDYNEICTRDPQGTFHSWARAGLRDLTGDGIPDYIVQTTESPSAFQVYIGTGAGFAAPIAIKGGFALSTETENCTGEASKTTSGLFDIDGDGQPEGVFFTSGSLQAYQLAGGVRGRPEAGKLVRIDNGYGAVTSITYRSAKEDARTSHQIPSPEIVADSLTVSGNMGLGGTLATTYYAYGDISLFYDSARDGFRSSGYARRIEVTPSPDGIRQSKAVVIDSYKLPTVTANTILSLSETQRFARYLEAGRVSDVAVLAGLSDPSPWSLLTVNLDFGPLIGRTHYDYDTNNQHVARFFTDAIKPADDVCKDIMFPYDYDLSIANNSTLYNPCSSRGFLFPLTVRTWRGTSASPAQDSVEAFVQLNDVDDLGRTTSVYYGNDSWRVDDDVCVDTTFATPVTGPRHVLGAISSRRVRDCSPRGGTAIFADESYEYDHLLYSWVSDGHPTAHTVYLYETDTGNPLGGVREWDASYNGAGLPYQVVTTRGTDTRTKVIGYDEFALAPTTVSVSGTSVPTLETVMVRDPVTLAVQSASDNQCGAIRGTTFDGFGRPMLTTVKPGCEAGEASALAARQYVGFEVGAQTGRSVVVKQFADPVPTSEVWLAEGRTTTTRFDELGRVLRSEVSLGGDYADERLVAGERKYDPFGRVSFAADPYPASADPATAYGTTRFFRIDGSLALEVRGQGPQPYLSTPDPTVDRYPTLYDHTFVNHTEVVSARTADAMTAVSPQDGVVRQTETSAVGRLLGRSTWQNGAAIERATFGYDKLGHQTRMTRYQDPVNWGNPVSTYVKLNSRGQVLQLTEPATTPQVRKYSDWGELMEVAWTPPSPEPAHSIKMEYDAYGRITHSEELNGGALDDATVNDFTYDVPGSSPLLDPTHVLGRLSTATSPNGEVLFSYDEYGRVNAKSYTDITNAVYIEKHGFHADGSAAWVELNLPDNNYRPERMDYMYDSAERLRWMSFSDGINTQELYNATQLDVFGRLRAGTFGVTNYTAEFAPTGRRLPTSVSVSAMGGTRTITFDGYDAVGRETRRTETGGSSVFQQESQYDAIGRLSSSFSTAFGSSSAYWTFDYDPLGNIRSLNEQMTGSSVQMGFTGVDKDEVCFLGYPYALVPNNGGCNVTHDSFGNVVNEPTRGGGHNQFTYFNSGAPRTITSSSGAAAELKYDAFGALQELDVTSGVAPQRVDRHHGPYMLSRTQSDGTTYTAREFPGPGIIISRRGATGPWVFEFSEARGTRVATDDAGNFVQDIKYSPFGVSSSVSNVPADPLFTTEQWNGGEVLDGLDVMVVGKRLYDPVIGRFLSRDPLLIARTSSASNPYAFAKSDPVNYSDPTGLDACGQAGATCAIGKGWDPATDTEYGLGLMVVGSALWGRAVFDAAVIGLSSLSGAPDNPQGLFVIDEGSPLDLSGLTSGIPAPTFGTDYAYSDVSLADVPWGKVATEVAMFILPIALMQPEMLVGSAEMMGGEIALDALAVDAVEVAATDAAVEAAETAGVAAAEGAGESALVDVSAVMRAGAAEGVAEAAPTLSVDVDALAQYGQQVRLQSDGYFNVVTHANANEAYVLRGGDWTAVSHRSLAQFIERSPGYTGGPVRLIGCNAGACARGLAQNLANKLGVDVLAPTGRAFVDANGSFWTEGTWQLFTPK